MWRPGGGAYTDYRLHDFVDKAGEITRQTADLPGYVTDIQSEIENFPYNVLKKGPYSTAMEACLYVAAGCTGAAFNVIPACTEDPAVVRALLEEIYRREPFMRRMAETFGRAPLAGVHTGWSRDGQAGTDRFYEGWPDHTFAREIFELGMPQAGPASAAQVYLLTLPNVRAMDDGRLREVLRTGAYVEPEALEELDRRGYVEYTGFRVREYRTVDSIEVYCDTPFHRGIFPGRRNGRQAFYRGTAAVLEPLSPDCQVLSCLTDYNGAVTAPCCMGLFENKLGGRICAAGYYPWAMLEDTQKSRQIRRIFDYLTRGKLISSVESFCRVHNWTRRLPDGRVAAALLNASLDRLTGCRIRVRTTAETGCWVDMDGKETRLSSEPGPEGSRLFTLPDFAPWSLGMLVTDR